MTLRNKKIISNRQTLFFFIVSVHDLFLPLFSPFSSPFFLFFSSSPISSFFLFFLSLLLIFTNHIAGNSLFLQKISETHGIALDLTGNAHEICVSKTLKEAIPDAETHLSTSNLVGTVGYIAPEYHQTLKFTDKSDIYSFGVLLGVLVMGKLPSDNFFQETNKRSLVQWMRNVII